MADNLNIAVDNTTSQPLNTNTGTPDVNTVAWNAEGSVQNGQVTGTNIASQGLGQAGASGINIASGVQQTNITQAPSGLTQQAQTGYDWMNEYYNAVNNQTVQNYQNQFEQAYQTQQNANGQIDQTYQQSANDIAQQFAIQRQNMGMGIANAGINTGLGAQMSLSLNQSYMQSMSQNSVAHAQALQAGEQALVDLELQYRTAIAEAIGNNDLQRAASLYEEIQNDENRKLIIAQTMAQYGDYSGYKEIYGSDTADMMQQAYDKNKEEAKSLENAEMLASMGDFSALADYYGWSDEQYASAYSQWIYANPGYAYYTGKINATQYYGITGQLPSGTAISSSSSSGGSGGSGGGGGGGGNNNNNQNQNQSSTTGTASGSAKYTDAATGASLTKDANGNFVDKDGNIVYKATTTTTTEGKKTTTYTNAKGETVEDISKVINQTGVDWTSTQSGSLTQITNQELATQIEQWARQIAGEEVNALDGKYYTANGKQAGTFSLLGMDESNGTIRYSYGGQEYTMKITDTGVTVDRSEDYNNWKDGGTVYAKDAQGNVLTDQNGNPLKTYQTTDPTGYKQYDQSSNASEYDFIGTDWGQNSPTINEDGTVPVNTGGKTLAEYAAQYTNGGHYTPTGSTSSSGLSNTTELTESNTTLGGDGSPKEGYTINESGSLVNEAGKVVLTGSQVDAATGVENKSRHYDESGNYVDNKGNVILSAEEIKKIQDAYFNPTTINSTGEAGNALINQNTQTHKSVQNAGGKAGKVVDLADANIQYDANGKLRTQEEKAAATVLTAWGVPITDENVKYFADAWAASENAGTTMTAKDMVSEETFNSLDFDTRYNLTNGITGTEETDFAKYGPAGSWGGTGTQEYSPNEAMQQELNNIEINDVSEDPYNPNLTYAAKDISETSTEDFRNRMRQCVIGQYSWDDQGIGSNYLPNDSSERWEMTPSGTWAKITMDEEMAQQESIFGTNNATTEAYYNMGMYVAWAMGWSQEDINSGKVSAETMTKIADEYSTMFINGLGNCSNNEDMLAWRDFCCYALADKYDTGWEPYDNAWARGAMLQDPNNVNFADYLNRLSPQEQMYADLASYGLDKQHAYTWYHNRFGNAQTTGKISEQETTTGKTTDKSNNKFGSALSSGSTTIDTSKINSSVQNSTVWKNLLNSVTSGGSTLSDFLKGSNTETSSSSTLSTGDTTSSGNGFFDKVQSRANATNAILNGDESRQATLKQTLVKKAYESGYSDTKLASLLNITAEEARTLLDDYDAKLYKQKLQQSTGSNGGTSGRVSDYGSSNNTKQATSYLKSVANKTTSTTQRTSSSPFGSIKTK